MKFGEAYLPSTEKQETATTSTETTASTEATQEAAATTSEQATETTGETTTSTETTTVPELNDESVLSYLKTKSGKEISAIEELFKDPEKVIETKEVNPWQDILDDDDQQYLNFKKETGRTRKEFDALKTNYDELDPVDLAVERARKDSGMNLSKEKAFAYLEKKLNVDLSDLENIDEADQIELASYTKSFREEKKSEAQKYLTPIERQPKEGEINKADYEIFEDGSMVPKSVIETRAKEQQQQYNQFLEENKKSVDSVAEAKFTITIDENGTKKDLSYSYEYSPEDRQAMLSTTNDVSGVMAKTYRDENGVMNHALFNEDMFWSQKANREKALASIVHKVRAELIEETHKRDNNVNFNRNSLQTNGSKKVDIALDGDKKGFGFSKNFI